MLGTLTPIAAALTVTDAEDENKEWGRGCVDGAGEPRKRPGETATLVEEGVVLVMIGGR